MAKTMGSLAIDNNISGLTILAIDKPMNTSASTIASSKVSIFLWVENSAFSEERFSLSFLITPLLSNITIFSRFAPKDWYKREHEIAAAPAPLITILVSSIFLLVSSNAFNNAAAEIMAEIGRASCRERV